MTGYEPSPKRTLRTATTVVSTSGLRWLLSAGSLGPLLVILVSYVGATLGMKKPEAAAGFGQVLRWRYV
jgi:hypothetical protein